MTLSDTMQFSDRLFGLPEPLTSLNLVQVSMRAVLIYLAGYIILRIGANRFVGRNTPFDIILGFIFGSTLAAPSTAMRRCSRRSSPPSFWSRFTGCW